MWRVLLRVAAVLLTLHGLSTLALARVVYPHDDLLTLLFAEHGFAFLFLVGLNLAVWSSPPRTGAMRTATHLANVLFLALSVGLATLKPEPPMVVAAVLIGLLTIAGVGLEVTTGKTPKDFHREEKLS